MREHSLFQLTLLRFREFVREPEALFWAFAFPIVLAAGLGIAFRNQPAETVHVAAVSHSIAEALRADKLLVVEELAPDAAREQLRIGKVSLVAEPGPDGAVLYRFDDTNPDGRAARMLADRAIQVAAGRIDLVHVQDDVAREPGSRYIDFLVPGMVGLSVMNNAIWAMGFTIVDSRRRKLMKRLVATPMKRHYYLLSFLLFRMVLLPFEVGIPIGFGSLFFGVPLRGSLIQLALLCVIGSISFASLGLLIASRAKTIEAVSGIMNFTMLPMWVLSGVFFSAQRFPDVVQPLIQSLPLTALNDALRANMLQGASFGQLGPQLGVLAAYLVVSFSIALKIFRWR